MAVLTNTNGKSMEGNGAGPRTRIINLAKGKQYKIKIVFFAFYP